MLLLSIEEFEPGHTGGYSRMAGREDRENVQAVPKADGEDELPSEPLISLFYRQA